MDLELKYSTMNNILSDKDLKKLERILKPAKHLLIVGHTNPDPDARGERQVLGGDVPSPFNPPPGCKFQGRCPLVEPRCREEEIDFYPINENHMVRCWKAAG